MNRYENMTDEQLIDMLRAGQEEITDYIMNKYKNLVRKKAKAMYLIGGESDDLIQEGMIGLFKAIRDYKIEKEASFFSFAELCISRQLYSAVQASNRLKHIPLNSYVSLYLDVNHSTEEETPLLEVLQSLTEKSPEEKFIDQENVSNIEKQLEKNLSKFENEVLKLYITGLGYIQIAEILDKPAKSVDNALQRIKNKLSSILL
ncbi:RNA polymerase sporulation sigma factor SigH [Anaerosacchariphilus polymeriproducens]|uniref:RNA polymerase sigma factor SigS n=1 Tax=Anaerosacchariphilus polymeriproducens TaxID=1812858 RepID=A0A371ASH3_9FIRM|nr:RNA polymerase sporulation sigma factor SigH [Anaerosacchariphilus polymeriproducens]RDU22515.1 RNA polymerase sporulation sigma factor SigH [Anaerosacchariphilus polymeriproducens]